MLRTQKNRRCSYWVCARIISMFLVCSAFHIIAPPFSALAEDLERTHIRVDQVRGTVHSRLEAIAVNAEPITPTTSPEVHVGDLVSYRVIIVNSHEQPHFNVRSETQWGRGLVMEGDVFSPNLETSHDPFNRKIGALIPDMQPDKADVLYDYFFDLRVVDFRNAYVSVYSDPVYACDVLQIHHVTVLLQQQQLAQLSADRDLEALEPLSAPGLTLWVSPECRRVDQPMAPLSWIIYVMNPGKAAVADAKVKNVLGRNLDYVHSSLNGEGVFPSVRDDEPGAGLTTLEWDLGRIAPGEMKAVRVSVLSTALERSEPDDYFNTVSASFGDGLDCCGYREIKAPCFRLPGQCVPGDVLEQCGRLHAFFAYTQLYKSNIYREAKKPEGVWATYLTPGIWLALPGSCERIVEIVTSSATSGGLAVSPFYPAADRTSQFYLLYSPQFETYYGTSEKIDDRVSHQADGYYRYDTGNRFSFRVFDQYKRSSDSVSSRVFDIKDRYTSNLFNSLVTFDPTAKTRLRLDYSNYYLNYDDASRSRADRMDNSVSAYAYYRVTPKISIFANYEISDINYFTGDLDSRENRMFGGLRWEPTAKTGGQIKAGYGVKSYDRSDLTDLKTWMAEVQIDHSFTPRTRAVLNAYRRYDEALGQLVGREVLSPDYYTKAILSHFIGLSLQYDLTTKLRFNVHGKLFQDAYQDQHRSAGFKERKDTEYAVSPTIIFNAKRWLDLSLAYTYTNRRSNYPQYNAEDHTVLMRFTVHR